MTGQQKIAHGYRVSVRQPANESDGYHLFYAQRGLQQVRGNGADSQAPPPFEAVAQIQGDAVEIVWVNPPKDLETTQEDFEQDGRDRVRLLHDWLARLSGLVHSVESWAKELGWSTRLIDSPLEDSQIGHYRAPALLMQEGTDRVLLEPVGRLAPGTEGVVDLYLMPAYDDIATLYHYDGCWNVHHVVPGTVGAPNTRQAPAKPLSKETLQEVLAEMRSHAA